MEQIKMYWWKSKKLQNFGDILNPVLIKGLTGKEVVWTDKSPKLMGCGTVLDHMGSGDQVWGSGVANQDRNHAGKNVKVFAVRGPLTRDVLLQSNIDCPPVYGDPAILLPRIFPQPKQKKDYVIGVVPHYIDYADVLHRRCGQNIHVINILSGIENVIKEMVAFQYVFSSCLHGIIAAEAYGIPACWVRFSDKIKSPVFKFKDYYKGTGREVDFVDMRKAEHVFETDKCLPSPDLSKMQDTLLEGLNGVIKDEESGPHLFTPSLPKPA